MSAQRLATISVVYLAIEIPLGVYLTITASSWQDVSATSIVILILTLIGILANGLSIWLGRNDKPFPVIYFLALMSIVVALFTVGVLWLCHSYTTPCIQAPADCG